MEHEPVGDPLRVVREMYRLDPEGPPGAESRPMLKVWRGTILRFPMIGSAGVYVHKPNSQHCTIGGIGNAGDWTAPPTENTDAKLVGYLWDVFEWQLAQARIFQRSGGERGLPISELIFRGTIATLAHGFTRRAHTGVFHAAHVHTSAYPLRLECT